MERWKIMIHSNLVKFFNKHWFIQLVLCFLPSIMISIYLFAYGCNIADIVNMCDYNNKMVKSGLDSNSIKEVSLFEKKSENNYSAVIEGSGNTEEEVGLGNEIYSVAIIDNSWYKIITSSGKELYQTECEFFSVRSLTDNKYEVKVGKDSFKVNKGDIICSVFLDKSGDYRVKYNTKGVAPKVLDFVSTLQVTLKQQDKYKLKVSSSYKKDFDDIDLKFCTNLPTNNMYFDETSKTFIKNLDKDFYKVFIQSSNILVVLVSMVAFCILLSMIRKKDDLFILKHREVILVDYIWLVSLVVCLFITVALLK